jgi:hypothetical protein
LALRSFTEFDSTVLGGALSHIATKPANRVLRRDFPAILRLYGNPVTARETVKTRQATIRNGTFDALAVMAGRSADDAQVIGVTTFTMLETPGKRGLAPNLAIWLDLARDPEFRKIGVALMELRMERLIDDLRFSGRPWTVIRPDNTASTTVWRSPYDAYGWKGFAPIGTPKRYPSVDGLWRKRQLFICKKSLEELR